MATAAKQSTPHSTANSVLIVAEAWAWDTLAAISLPDKVERASLRVITSTYLSEREAHYRHVMGISKLYT